MLQTARPLRIDLDEMQSFTDLMEFERRENEPRRSAQDRLVSMTQLVHIPEMTLFGFVLEKEAGPVGYVLCENKSFGAIPGMLGCFVIVHPEYRRKGIGRCLYEMGRAEAERLEFTKLMSAIRADDETAKAFLIASGFEQVDQSHQLEFVVDSSVQPDTSVTGKDADEQGIRYASLAELAEEDEDWLASLQDLCIAFRHDLPTDMSDYDWIPDDLDGFRVVLETQKVDMHGSFVAIMDDMPVATAWLSRMDADKDWCIHVLTGTRRDYRRRGLVRGLKQHGFAWCSEVGIKTIYTSQQHTNEAMLRLNQSLGFKITATHLTYCKMI